MNQKMSVEEYMKKTGRISKASKYNNKKVEVDGVIVDSKLEAKHITEFTILVQEGELIARIPQVSIPLTQGKDAMRMRIDHMLIHEVYEDGTFRAELVDSKGYPTRDWTNKNKFLKDKYGISVRVKGK